MIPNEHDPRRESSSKPRASGDDPRRRIMTGTENAVNPARAGMIPPSLSAMAPYEGKPRASGDDPAKQNAVAKALR